MRKNLLLVFSILFCFHLFAQTPKSINYQSVVRDGGGVVLPNKIVSLRISILKGNPNGTSVYTETQSKATNEFGVVNLNIGEGTIVSGNFSNINWGDDKYFLQLELDIKGGNDFQFMGTSQMLSVPYALYAERANVSNTDTSSTNELQTITRNGTDVTLSKGGGTVSIADNDNDPNNEIQTLNINGNKLEISKGNSVVLSGAVDLDADPTNEIQTVTRNGNDITLSKGGGTVNIADDDNDPTNEIQQISKNGNTITLSKNGGTVTETDNQTLSTNGNNLTISNGNTVSIDTDPTNELQTLSLNGNSLSISKGNAISLLDNDPKNELQALTYKNDTLYLSKSNFVIIPLSKLLPSGTCLNSIDQTPPPGYVFTSAIKTNPWLAGRNLTIARTEATIAIANNKIYLLGGTDYNGGYYTGAIKEYDPAADTWKTKNTKITGNLYAFTIKNKIYTCGKSDMSDDYSFGIYEYDPILDANNLKRTISRNNPTIIVVNDKFYIFGGYQKEGQTEIIDKTYEGYDPTTNSTLKSGNMPDERQRFSLASYVNSIYLFGGSDNSQPSNYNAKVYEYNTLTDKWTQKKDMPNPAQSMIKLNLGNKIYLMGGSGSGTYFQMIRIYDPSNDTWTVKNILPFGPEIPPVENIHVINNKIYFLNAIEGGSGYFYEYNPVNDEFISLGLMPLPRSGYSSTTYNEQIYVIGGSGTNGYTNNDIFNPKFLSKTLYIHCKQ